MAQLPSNLIEILDRMEPSIRRAFLEAISEITSRAELGRIAALLERGDVDGAIEAMHLDLASLRALDKAIADAFEAGGIFGSANLPARDVLGAMLVIRFDVRNYRAEEWLRMHGAAAVKAILEEQRAMLRDALLKGMEAGRNPLNVARSIAGYLNRETGLRQGGLIGLSAIQAEYVRLARLELESGDAALLRHYLTRALRDRRFDALILKAIREGKPLDAATIAKLLARYADRLLAHRAQTIARTEGLAALNAGRHEAYLQAIQAGKVRAEDVTRVWRDSADNRVRDTHRDLSGTSVGMYEHFVTTRGNRLLYPGDPNAPAEEIINCRCIVDYRIDYLANLRRASAS